MALFSTFGQPGNCASKRHFTLNGWLRDFIWAQASQVIKQLCSSSKVPMA